MTQNPTGVTGNIIIVIIIIILIIITQAKQEAATRKKDRYQSPEKGRASDEHKGMREGNEEGRVFQ